MAPHTFKILNTVIQLLIEF